VRHEAFSAFLPPSMLARHTREERVGQWRTHLGSPEYGVRLFVLRAEEPEGRLVGLASCGPPESEVPGFDAHLYRLYVEGSHRRRGVGLALLRASAERLRRAGFRALFLWTPVANAEARSFYERLGGRVVAERREETPHGTSHRVAYGWPDLAVLEGERAVPRA
jgi:ribosomal protein S18 acetylase RimI-like enzyme